MSIFSDLLEKITGLDLDGSSQNNVKHPCSNCPSSCTIAGEACALCEPYKKKLIDAVYHVDHIEEFRAQYEVVPNAAANTAGGTITCPRCGGPSANHNVCDYCGAKLSDAPVPSGKIQVASASDIPNPIMEAQDIIYDRYDAIVKKYASQKDSSGSLLGNLFSELFGSESGSNSESALGKKMSESEIREAASLYKVTVGDYLTGLDNGKYLNLSAKKEADAQGQSSWSPASMGMSGMAGIGMFANALMFGSGGRRRPHDMPLRPSQFDRQRPSQNHPHPQQRPEQRPSWPSESRPSQNRPEQRPSRPSESRPNRQNDPQPSQRSQPSRPDHWKERDPGRRGRG